MMTIVMFILVILTSIIVLCGFFSFNTQNKKALKFAALFVLIAEIFKFFYNASFYEGGAAASNALSFSILTPITVLMLFGAFNDKKLGQACRNIAACAALAPLIFGAFNANVYDLPLDTFKMSAGLYFIQCGMLLAFSFLTIKGERANVFSALWAAVFIGVIISLTALTNLFWTSEQITVNYLFTDNAILNVLMCIIAPLSPFIVYISSYLLKEVIN